MLSGRLLQPLREAAPVHTQIGRFLWLEPTRFDAGFDSPQAGT